MCPICGTTMGLIYKRAWECRRCGHAEYVPDKKAVKRNEKENLNVEALNDQETIVHDSCSKRNSKDSRCSGRR